MAKNNNRNAQGQFTKVEDPKQSWLKGLGNTVAHAWAGFLGKDVTVDEIERVEAMLTEQAKATPISLEVLMGEPMAFAKAANLNAVQVIAHGGVMDGKGALVMLHLWMSPKSLKKDRNDLPKGGSVFAHNVHEFCHFLLGAPLENEDGTPGIDTEAYWQGVDGSTLLPFGERVYPGETPIKFKASLAKVMPVDEVGRKGHVTLQSAIARLRAFRTSGRGRVDVVVICQLAGKDYDEVNEAGAPTGFAVQPISGFVAFEVPNTKEKGSVESLARRGSTTPVTRSRVAVVNPLDAAASAPVVGAPAPTQAQALDGAAMQNYNPFAGGGQL